MNKRVACTSILASLMILNTSSAVFAAQASTNNVITGRTQQNNQTGVIIPGTIQTPIYHNVTKEITLIGTIIIDGPQLVFTVTDPNGTPVAADNIAVTKVADKTYTYSVKVNPSQFKGNVSFTLNAKTIYPNGKVAGQTHTSAPEQKQSIHVAYVSGFQYGNFTWGTYDRRINQYPYSYDLVKVWDDGTKVPQNNTGIVSGVESVLIQGNDPTYDGGSANVGTEIPPVNILSFNRENPIWTYNSVSNKYDLSFTLIKNLSNGKSESWPEAITGVAPLATYTYAATDYRSIDYSEDFTFTAPDAPISEIPAAVVSNVHVSDINSLWTGNNANGGNVQERYTLSYTINGQSFYATLSDNFTKVGTGFADQSLTYEAFLDGQSIEVMYILKYVEPASTGINTSNKSSDSAGIKVNNN